MKNQDWILRGPTGAGLAMHMFGRLHGIDLGGYHQSHLWVSTTVAAANVEEDDVHPTVDN